MKSRYGLSPGDIHCAEGGLWSGYFGGKSLN